LMKKKIEYFVNIKPNLELEFNRVNFAEVQSDLNASYNVYKICKDVKRYFQKKRSDAKEICKKFIKSFDEFVKNTNAYETFKVKLKVFTKTG